MNKPLKSLVSVLFMVLALLGGDRLFAQSGIFDRTGMVPGHGSYSSLPEESVDLFTGNLTLAYRDIFLPVSDGLNIEVWRVYNSKILQDKLSTQQNPTVQAYPKSMIGLGWTMHMGMIHNLTSNTPVIEFPDGRREIAFPPKTEYGYGSTIRITRDFLKFDKGVGPLSDPKLYFPNGVVWTFGNIASLPLAAGGTETVYMVTRIEDPLGNFIDIEYDASDYLRSISTITDSMDREVRFIKSYQGSDPAKLAEIRIRNHDDTHDVILGYSVGSFSNGFYKLSSFTPPGLPSTTFGYNDGLSNNYELTSVTTSYGGTLEYTYQNHYFYVSTTQLDSKVVSQKRITFNPGEQATWNYAYPTYQGASSGTATVDGPEFDTSATHYAYQSAQADRWKIGLETSAALSDGSFSATRTWTYHEISTTTWTVLGFNMGTARGPLPLSVTESPTGDSTLKRDYFYLRNGGTSVMRYGLPTKISYFINGSGTSKSYTELAYYFETHPSFKDKYMLAHLESTRDKSSAGVTQRETINSYFDETGKWGALKQLKRWKAGQTYYTWDFTYVRDAENVTISVDGPGAGGISQVLYRYGVEQEASAPGFLKYTRNVSKYGYVLSEWNQYRGTKSYDYDDLGRTTSVKLWHGWEQGQPPPSEYFLLISYNWRPNGENRLEITHGNNTTIQYWDGMGRGTGYTEAGDDTTLYYRKTLDAEGRVKFADGGHTSSAPEYAYLYDAAGRITRITDPRSEFTTISYSGHTRTVTDPENHATSYTYADLPGLPTALTDAQNHAASYAYDPVGRLTSVSYLGRTQSYSYDGLDHVLSEEHPETGLIEYAYDTANRLCLKSWGGATESYVYNSSGQLVSTQGAETVTYAYDDKGAVNSITGSSGWSRSSITYNDFGGITHESVTIPGLLGSKSLSYEYDDEGNLTSTTYPDGKGAVQTYNGLGRPETLTFNSGNIINSASYGPNKIPASIAAANGTTLGSTFYDNGTPHVVSLMRGGTPLYNATYEYDGAGNITGISSTAPAPALNAAFGYDSLNRLTSATYSTGDTGIPTAYTYDYDAYGNMLTVRHNGVIAFNKTYTAQNRINEVGYQYDARGNLTAASGRNFIWDAENRLRAVTDATGQFMAEYAYDNRGLRIAKLAPKPDIDVNGYPTGSDAHFTANLDSDCFLTFTIFNRGYNYLTIGTPQITGQDGFNVTQQPSSPVSPGQSTQLVICFHPTSAGDKTATLSIPSNDPDQPAENPYLINLRGHCVPNISIGGVQNHSYDFGTVAVGESERTVFSIRNTGTATLLLNGAPSLEESGGGFDFYLEEEGGPIPASIPAGGNAPFAIRFAPTGEGQWMATLTISSNDPDEGLCLVTFVGTGLNGPEKIIDDSELTLLSPVGGETLEAGSYQEIRWSGGEKTKCVKIEYSTDNGSTYRTLAERAANIGLFPWRVPEEASGSCLVRISDAEGAPALPAIISFEFNFRISTLPGDMPEGGEHFVFRAGVPDPKTLTYQVTEIAFAPDGLKGTENLLFNHAVWEIQGSERFLGRWHRARIAYDMARYTGSVWIDGEPVLAGVPLQPDLDFQGKPEISLSRGSVPVALWVDDVEVGFVDASLPLRDETGVAFRALFRDNFNRYEGALFPRQGGWEPERIEARQAGEIDTEMAAEGAKTAKAVETSEPPARSEVDDRVYASSARSLRLETSGEESGKAAKRFSLPERVPYCVSHETFSIVPAGEAAQTVKGTAAVEDRNDGDKRQKRWDGGGTGGSRPRVDRKEPGSSRPAAAGRASRSEEKGAKMMTSVPATGTFYIYAFDGRLLAEYDVNGLLVREYIYFAGMMVAEYRNQESRLLYYASDQINSTRIVTDNLGNVVYSAAHEPYGGIQKTWPSTYDPSLKFSGKERDGESDLDYFGARYYDRSLYRFLSADPAISLQRGVANPQYWNLFSYCGNNPIEYYDPDGRAFLIFLGGYNRLFIFDQSGVCQGNYDASSNPDPDDPDAYPYLAGLWHRTHYLPNAQGGYGFIGYDAPSEHWGARGVHSGNRPWWWYTGGCIRTTPEAMATIKKLETSGDQVKFLIVLWDQVFQPEDGFCDYAGIYSNVEFLLRQAGQSEKVISNVSDALDRFFEQIFGPLNFTYDYFFSNESPIPPGVDI